MFSVPVYVKEVCSFLLLFVPTVLSAHYDLWYSFFTVAQASSFKGSKPVQCARHSVCSVVLSGVKKTSCYHCYGCGILVWLCYEYWPTMHLFHYCFIT